MDSNNTLFCDNYLSNFLKSKFTNIHDNIELYVKNGCSLYDIQKYLNMFNDSVLILEHDLEYNPEIRIESYGEWPYNQKFHVIEQRFYFTGLYHLFYLQPNKSNLNPPIGLVDKEFLYFELFIPYQDNVNDFQTLSIRKYEEYKKNIDFFLDSQKNDIQNFIRENQPKLEEKFIFLSKENDIKNNFMDAFSKTIKNNLLTTDSTEVPNDSSVENFIKDLRNKNEK